MYLGELFPVLCDEQVVTVGGARAPQFDAETALEKYKGQSISHFTVDWIVTLTNGGASPAPFPVAGSYDSQIRKYNFMRQAVWTPKPQAECARENKAEGSQLAVLATRLGFRSMLESLDSESNGDIGTINAAASRQFIHSYILPLWVPALGKRSRTLMSVAGSGPASVVAQFCSDAYINGAAGTSFAVSALTARLVAHLVPKGRAIPTGPQLNIDFARVTGTPIKARPAGLRPHFAVFFDPTQGDTAQSMEDRAASGVAELDLTASPLSGGCEAKYTRMTWGEIIRANRGCALAFARNAVEQYPPPSLGLPVSLNYFTMRSLHEASQWSTMLPNAQEYTLTTFGNHTFHDCWIPVSDRTVPEVVKSLEDQAVAEMAVRGTRGDRVYDVKLDADDVPTGIGGEAAAQAMGAMVLTRQQSDAAKGVQSSFAQARLASGLRLKK